MKRFLPVLAVAHRDWRRYGLISLATIAVLVVPFLIWAPGPFLSQQLAFQHMLDTIRSGFERFGFVPVETPVFELSDVLLTKTAMAKFEELLK